MHSIGLDEYSFVKLYTSTNYWMHPRQLRSNIQVKLLGDLREMFL